MEIVTTMTTTNDWAALPLTRSDALTARWEPNNTPPDEATMHHPSEPTLPSLNVLTPTRYITTLDPWRMNHLPFHRTIYLLLPFYRTFHSRTLTLPYPISHEGEWAGSHRSCCHNEKWCIVEILHNVTLVLYPVVMRNELSSWALVKVVKAQRLVQRLLTLIH